MENKLHPAAARDLSVFVLLQKFPFYEILKLCYSFPFSNEVAAYQSHPKPYMVYHISGLRQVVWLLCPETCGVVGLQLDISSQCYHRLAHSITKDS